MKKLFTLALSVLCINAFSQEVESNDEILSYFEMSLEELLNVKITSASNVEESLNRAPATMIVITASDIADRGYLEMFDVLNDLPGFDLSRAFGDDNYYLYARGYRKETSDQMLLMVDGLAMNHLYSNNMNLFAMYPLYNVQQIEIVYGPASAVYGPNAFAGVINVITKKSEESNVFMNMGANNTYFTDVNLNKKFNDLSIRFSGRLYDTDGFDLSNRTAAIDSRLYSNLDLWGPFKDTEFLKYHSPINANFLSSAVHYKGLTLGLINFLYETGYGAEWPADKVLNAQSWGFDEQTYYARYETNINTLGAKPISSKTLFRYRQSGHPNTSLFVERYSGGVDASYWQTTNNSLSFFQDFAYTHSDKFSANFGLKYDRRTLQGAYNENYGPFVDSDSLFSYPFPEQPDRNITKHNHFNMQDKGAYIQLKYSPITALDVIGGIRYDDNSIFGGVFNPRAGIVYEAIPGLIAKLFYGSAYLEPTARILYGGWQGSLSNVDLKPERINTFEGSVSYSKGNFSNSINVFMNQGYNVISGATNIGKRKMVGVEYAGKLVVNNSGEFLNRLKADLYISYINSEEDKEDGAGYHETGNMAPLKVRCILTAYLAKNISISLQNRWTDEISTVASNPIDKIESHFVSDAFIAYKNLFVENLTLGLKVYNILNTDYYHPGYRGANAGENFIFNNDGGLDESVSGSTGWYNSRLPQPKRTVQITLNLKF